MILLLFLNCEQNDTIKFFFEEEASNEKERERKSRGKMRKNELDVEVREMKSPYPTKCDDIQSYLLKRVTIHFNAHVCRTIEPK